MDTVLPYGTWPSPVTAHDLATAEGRLSWLTVVDGAPWWNRSQPTAGGRIGLFRDTPDGPQEVLPAPWNVRSRVHEYGGRAYTVAGDQVVFAQFTDQRLYLAPVDGSAAPVPLTPVPARASGLRYAEPFVVGDEVWAICEEHLGPDPTDLRRFLAAVPLDGAAAADRDRVRELVVDGRFLACPRLSPDGRLLSWITWDHPDMPWDSTRLQVAPVQGGTVGTPVTVAGGADVAVVQAEWLGPGELVISEDSSGWWQLTRLALTDQGRPTGPATPLTSDPVEHGGALWNLGSQWFSVLGPDRLAVLAGTTTLALHVLDLTDGRIQLLGRADQEWATAFGGDATTLWGIAGDPHTGAEVVRVRVADGQQEVLGTGPADGAQLDPQWCTDPYPAVFTGVGGREVHAIVHPPHHPQVTGPDGTVPPWVVWVHGGPTGRFSPVLDPEVAYFTSRGLGVVQVNYGGSVGYGRQYRNRLREAWGVVDVEDCAAVAHGLVHAGLADPARIAIRGGSAGGWTSAASLTSTDVYACGLIVYPILDLAGWRTGETHDFESQYLESLVGPWPATEQRYRDRSPVDHADQVHVPFVLQQGLDDVICPPSQCDRFLAAVAGRGVPHAYQPFAGEMHGFRLSSTIEAALAAELSLYSQVFGLDRDDVPVIELAP